MKRASIRSAVLTMILLLFGVSGAWAAFPVQSDQGVVFSYQAPDAQAVFLAGDFNGWNATALPLVKDGAGLWSVSVPLPAGTHEYKFVVDGAWVEDPDNPEKKSDPFGGANNVLKVGAGYAVLGSAPAVTAQQPPKAAQPQGKVTVGPPRSVDGGVEFTYDGPSATTVNLAGSFNGWNATELPLQNDGQGHWRIVHALPAGKHEYKFVVDGAWFADPENPDTQADPYGGANSLVTVDDKGQLVAGGGESAGGDQSAEHRNNTALNARLYLGGRYLTRMVTAKNVLDDPRYRMQRPTQTVDLNFDTQVSDVAETYMRIRLDSDQNIIQNNIAGFLDEANLIIHPDKFRLKAYWNQEAYTLGDLIPEIGDQDLPGTIGHDHLDIGKGTAGAVFSADPLGIHTSAFMANVHNADFYNNPDLFDNTGQDIMALRFSRKIGRLELGLPSHLKRSLIWLDFNDLVSQPSTGIPILDQHRAATGDGSTWYETDSYDLKAGLDARFQMTPVWQLAGEVEFGKLKQRIVTGNESGENNSNGALDLPFLDRDQTTVRLEANYRPNDNLQVMVQHTFDNNSGASADQRQLDFQFKSQAEANKNIYFTIGQSPAEVDLGFSEIELKYHRNELDLGLWAWHRGFQYDYAPAGATVPGDSTRTSRDQDITYLSGNAGYGRPDAGYGHGEMEFGWRWNQPDLDGSKERSLELITRYERNLTRATSVIADVRFIAYHLVSPAQTRDPSYWAPFLGLRHRPIRNLELVLGYGVDPVDFSIDYHGRQLGRWWYRQNYLFDNPGATLQDAEDYLSKARVITLRAQFIF